MNNKEHEKEKKDKFYRPIFKTSLLDLANSLLFFNLKKKKVYCVFCKRDFTTNGLGGHMSKCQGSLVKNYTIRQKIKKNLQLEKKKRKLIYSLNR